MTAHRVTVTREQVAFLGWRHVVRCRPCHFEVREPDPRDAQRTAALHAQGDQP